MKLPVVHGEELYCDLQEIAHSLRRQHPAQAERFLRAVYRSFDQLSLHPQLGRKRPEYQKPALRSWGVRGFEHYLIFYSVRPDDLFVYRIIHGSRDLDAELSSD